MDHNVKPETAIRYPYLESVAATLDNEINRWGETLKEVLPYGFQSIIEIEDLDTEKIDLRHSVLHPGPQSGKISGSFAQVKMDTLRKFPELAMTGALTINELVMLINRLRANFDASKIACLEDVSQLTRAQQEELRDKLNITAYLGGIRIPFERRFFSSVKGTMTTEKKEARFAFSALTGEGDLTMCFCFFQDLQHALQNAEPNVTYHFNLSKLKANRTANFLIAMGGICEVIGKK